MADLLRVGVTNGLGGRMSGYRDSHPDMITHVNMMVLEHHEPGHDARDRNLGYESFLIEKYRPPFNDRGNDDFDRQEGERARILAQPVTLLNRVDLLKMKTRRLVSAVTSLAVAAMLGAAGLGAVLLYL